MNENHCPQNDFIPICIYVCTLYWLCIAYGIVCGVVYVREYDSRMCDSSFLYAYMGVWVLHKLLLINCLMCVCYFQCVPSC